MFLLFLFPNHVLREPVSTVYDIRMYSRLLRFVYCISFADVYILYWWTETSQSSGSSPGEDNTTTNKAAAFNEDTSSTVFSSPSTCPHHHNTTTNTTARVLSAASYRARHSRSGNPCKKIFRLCYVFDSMRFHL